MQYFVEGFKKAFDFKGRANRPQYWFFTLGVAVVAFVLAILSAVLLPSEPGSSNAIGGLFSLLYIVWMLACIIPAIAISIRRMHDIGRSGWWVLINLVPFVGGIIFIILAILPSKN